MESEKRKDLLTGEEFVPKKISQLFAKPANRIKYNNKKASKAREKRAFIDKPMHSNHTILKSLLGKAKSKIISKDFMLGRGFDFGVFNHLINHEGTAYPSVYEFIIITNGKEIKIIKDDRYNND